MLMEDEVSSNSLLKRVTKPYNVMIERKVVDYNTVWYRRRVFAVKRTGVRSAVVRRKVYISVCPTIKALQEKDILEKTHESYNDVFADIVNVLVFNGERVIKEDDLEDRATFSAYKAEGRLRFQERDVSKYWRKSMVKLVLIGLENMTAVSRYMPLRVIGYDGAAYRDQIPERILSTFDLHTAVSGDGRFKEIAMLSKDKACTQEGEEVVTMRSQFIDNIWKRAKDEGEKIGEKRGERNGDHRATIRVLRRSIDNLLKKTNYTRDEILDILEVSSEERKQLELTQN